MQTPAHKFREAGPAASHPPTRRWPVWEGDLDDSGWDERTDRSGYSVSEGSGQRPGRAGKAARGLAGSLAAGLLLLALSLVGTQFWATQAGYQGPGLGAVISHLVAAIVAVVLVSIADRRADKAGTFSTWGAFAVVLGSLWFWWWL